MLTPVLHLTLAHSHENRFHKVKTYLTSLIERIVRAVQTFINSFHHPSAEITRMRSKEHDRVRNKSWPPLLNAVYFHKHRYLEHLLKTQAVNQKALDGATALHAAALTNNIQAAQILLAKGAHIEATEMRGQTPMHWAAHEGHVVMINWLATQGAKVDVRDDRNKTPLRMAAKHGRLPAVASLIALGANREALDDKRQTPYFVARLQGRVKVENYLRGLGVKTNGVNYDQKCAEDVAGRAGLRAYLRSLLS